MFQSKFMLNKQQQIESISAQDSGPVSLRKILGLQFPVEKGGSESSSSESCACTLFIFTSWIKEASILSGFSKIMVLNKIQFAFSFSQVWFAKYIFSGHRHVFSGTHYLADNICASEYVHK